MPTVTPWTSSTELERSSEERRQQLAQTWPTAGMVDKQMGLTPEDTVQPTLVATRMRLNGDILGVYMSRSGSDHYRYPSWQFDEEGKPIPQVREILSILRTHGPFLDEKERTTGWGEAAWFVGAHALLDSKSPADMLATCPDRVVEAARREFAESRDSNW